MTMSSAILAASPTIAIRCFSSTDGPNCAERQLLLFDINSDSVSSCGDTLFAPGEQNCAINDEMLAMIDLPSILLGLSEWREDCKPWKWQNSRSLNKLGNSIDVSPCGANFIGKPTKL